MSATPDERLVQLEILAAEQERTIGDLSGQLAEQWKLIEALRATVEALRQRFSAVEEQMAPDVPVTRPPHY